MMIINRSKNEQVDEVITSVHLMEMWALMVSKKTLCCMVVFRLFSELLSKLCIRLGLIVVATFPV